MDRASLQEIIMASLSENDPFHESSKVVARGGDASFDFIVQLMREGSLSDSQMLNALSRLALLIQHVCHTRTSELLVLCLDLLASPRVAVSSGAAGVAVRLVQILEGLPAERRNERFRVGASPSMREQVQSALRHVRNHGIQGIQIDVVDAFLANRE